jgi:hypothetical protein
MKTKHTHTGDCQVCGARQAAENGNNRLALHGYTKTMGFFNGTCFGSRNFPSSLTASSSQTRSCTPRSAS